MPRNPEKKVYITIGLARDSAILSALQAEAQVAGVSLAQMIVLRLVDAYQGTGGPGERALAARPGGPSFQGQLPDVDERAAQAATAWAMTEEE